MSETIAVTPGLETPLRRRIAMLVLVELRGWALVFLAALAVLPLSVSRWIGISAWVSATYFAALAITAGIVGAVLVVREFRSVMSDVNDVDRERQRRYQEG